MATSSGRTCLLLLSDTFQQTFSEKICLPRGGAWQVRARTIFTDIGDVYLAEIVLGDNIAGGLLVAFERHLKRFERQVNGSERQVNALERQLNALER